MRAVCWMGKQDVQVRQVPDPSIINPRDAVIKVNLTAICGSDLHLYDGYIPTMKEGDIIGHEVVGEVVDTGPGLTDDGIEVGDRVVIPFPIACGNCHYCGHDEFALCDNSNPNAGLAEAAYGYSAAGIFGYSHLLGGYAGGQAEYMRVPFADVGPLVLPDNISDEDALFLSDIFPTGYHAAANCDIGPDDTVAVWGCGPVGLFTIKSALLLGAKRVVGIDRVAERLEKARQHGAEILNFSDDNVLNDLREMTGGRGPDAVIDAVGLEAHGVTAVDQFYDSAKQRLHLETDRPNALRQAIMACAKGGTVSVPGVYGGLADKIPLGAAFAKGLTFRMGQTPVQRYMDGLLDHIVDGDIDPSFVISHRVPLSEAPAAYQMFRDKKDRCTKVVMYP